MDLQRESDIEQLRRIALAQQVQIEQLLRLLRGKCQELEAFKGDPAELQQTLKLLETLVNKAQRAKADAANAPSSDESEKDSGLEKKKARSKTGPTPQPSLPAVELTFELVPTGEDGPHFRRFHRDPGLS